MIITLLHFIYLTLPFCAGIDLKTLNKEEKQKKKKVQRGRKMKSLASNSQRRASRGRSINLHALNSLRRMEGEYLAIASAFTREVS